MGKYTKHIYAYLIGNRCEQDVKSSSIQMFGSDQCERGKGSNRSDEAIARKICNIDTLLYYHCEVDER